MINAGIIGGSGYTAGELLRLLLSHTQLCIDFVFSTTNAGKKISSVHQDLSGQTTLAFTDRVNPDVDVVFLCLGHGNSTKFLAKHPFSQKTKIIDLSSDFRTKENSGFRNDTFVYGLPELNKAIITRSRYVANPGCFATAIQLALLPLVKKAMLHKDIHINAITGSTGAGVKPTETTHFSWRDNNFSWYKAFNHQHLDEIKQSITQLQPHFQNELYFIPYRGNFSRGIFATTYTEFDNTLEEAYQIYETYYREEPFVRILRQPLHLKQVVNTNNCFIHLHKSHNMLFITSIIDNLLKGASGQAVQNMNLLFRLNENEGLRLKANYF